MPIFIRKPIDLFVQFCMVHGFGSKFGVVTLAHDFGFVSFGGSSPSGILPDVPRDAEGHAVQPRAEGIGLLDRSGFPGKDQKNRLSRVLRLMDIAEDVETHAVNDRAVPLDQRGKSGLGRVVLVGEEVVQEFGIRPVCGERCIPGRLDHDRCGSYHLCHLSEPSRRQTDLYCSGAMQVNHFRFFGIPSDCVCCLWPERNRRTWRLTQDAAKRATCGTRRAMRLELKVSAPFTAECGSSKRWTGVERGIDEEKSAFDTTNPRRRASYSGI